MDYLLILLWAFSTIIGFFLGIILVSDEALFNLFYKRKKMIILPDLFGKSLFINDKINFTKEEIIILKVVCICISYKIPLKYFEQVLKFHFHASNQSKG